MKSEMNTTINDTQAQQNQPILLGDSSWLPWHYVAKEGFILRGLRTVPRGLPVLHFIHGNSYSGLTYLPLWQQLAPYFDIFLHDAQGHGDSDHGGKFVGWQRSADLAREVWAGFAPEYASVLKIGMGHSFGGALTSLMSVANPTMFSQLLLLDPMLFPQPMIRWAMPLGSIGLNPIARKARRRRMLWPDRETALASLRGRGMFRGWHEDALAAYVDHAMHDSTEGRALKCLPQREAEVFSSYIRKLWPQLRQVEAPTHSFIGSDTYPFLHRSMADWQQAHPELNITSMQGGHCFMQENPVVTAQEILAAVAHQYTPKA